MDLELPGGVITTHCVSTVIRPGSKVTHDPLQFVKIQSTELSKKAVEQIRLAEQVKITKDKIKEVEEEWQNNLLNWKSKRRQSRSVGHSENSNSSENSENEAGSGGRKIKTFSEILNEKAKSGYRIGYNLQRYINAEDSEDEKFAPVDNSIDRKTETHVDKTIISQETELCDREVERIANRSDEHSDGSDVHDKDETTIDTPSDEGYNGRSSQCESAELRVTPESSSTLSESPIDAAATVATTLTTVTATIISTSLSTDPVPRQKPVIPPKPVIGERKSLPAVDVKIDQHNQLNHHQLIGRTNSDSIATIKSDKITNNYFRFTTKPYNNPRVTQGNGSKPVICHQDFLSSISSSPSPSPSSSSPLLSSFQESNNTKNSSNSNSNNNSSTNSSNNLNNSDLRKASFKHLGLSPQTSNSSITSNGSSSYNGSAIFHETIGRSVSSPLSQGTPQVIDSTVNCSSVNNNNNYNSINNNNNIENDSKRSNYPNILISPFKAHRPIINSVSSENLSNSQRSSSSSYPLGEKARSEAQLIKKSNENNLKSQDQRSMLSISGKKRCSNCGDELGRGCAAMVIETLSLYYHINCFRCCVCHIQLGNGTCGTDVRVRSNRIHCQNCYSNDEIGLTRV